MSEQGADIAEVVRRLAGAMKRPEPKCKNCRDTGWYFDNNGHGQRTWKCPCPCRMPR